MLKTIFLTVFFATVVVLTATYIYLGGYKEPEFFVDSSPTMYLAYKNILGNYSQTSFIINEVEKELAAQNIECTQSFGLFYDDPNKTVESDLRSKAGCLFLKKPAIEESSKLHLLKIPAYPKIVQASFKGSPALGPIKVYEQVKNWLQKDNAFPSLEVYSFKQNENMATQ